MNAPRADATQGIYPAPFAPLADVRRIAVLRANAIGDFVICLPALQALRDTHHDARILLLGLHWHADFLRGRPGPVDEVLVLPPVPGVNAPAGHPSDTMDQARFRERMRRLRLDLALQLHGGGRYSNPLVRSLGARLTVGLCAADAEPLDRNLPYQTLRAETLRLLEAVSLAGAVTPGPIEPRLCVTDADRAEAGAVLADDGRPLVVLQPGAKDARRRWPAAAFARVGDALAARGASIAVNASAEEAAISAAVVSGMRHPAHDLGGRLALRALVGLLERACLVVSNDTGPAHLARAVGAATVTIHWIGNLCSYGALSTARHRVAVGWRLSCPVCGSDGTHERCAHNESFVDDVSPDEVIAHAEALLSEALRRQPGARSAVR